MTNNEVLQRANVPSIEAMLLSRQLTWTGHIVRMNDDRLPKAVLYGEFFRRQSEMLEDHTYGTRTEQSDTSTPPISTRGIGRRWRTIAVPGVRPSLKEPQKLKPKEQLMPKSNDNAAMNVRLQIEEKISQSLHADTAEENWRLVLANYPMKELGAGSC